MNAKHTSGPWKYQKQNGSPTTGRHMICGSKPGYLAEVRDCGSGDVEANAILISSAPDLLVACANALDYLKSRNLDGGQVGASLFNAIAKATGAA